MILTERKPSEELLYYRALKNREGLTEDEHYKLIRLESGYEGELTYDEIFENIIKHLPVFRDIYLKIDGSVVQCDALIVHDDGYVLHEIKNYNGEYSYNGDQWLLRGKEISEDPIIQLERTRKKFIKLQYTNKIQLDIEGKVIFTHSDFSLVTTNTTRTEKVILRNNLKRNLVELKNLTYSDYSQEKVEIISKAIIKNPYFKEVANIESIKKGVYCRYCSNSDLKKLKYHFKCNNCSSMDTIHTITLQALSDYNALFRNHPFSKEQIYSFLDGLVSRYTVLRVIKFYCTPLNKGPRTLYKFNFHDFNEAQQANKTQMRYKDHHKIISKIQTIN